jgi:hypothetical protein
MKKSDKELVKALLASEKMAEIRDVIRLRREENNKKTKIWKVRGTDKPHLFERSRH